MKDTDFTYNIVTYGCQMNEKDSSTMAAMLDQIGGRESSRDDAQLLIFNTCCVREHAEDKVFGNVGALKKQLSERPNLIIGVCGCMMQQKGVAEKFMKKFPFVNFVMGTHNMHQLPQIVLQVVKYGERVCAVWDSEGEIIEELPLRTGKISSYVNIMFGCDNYCTYCIVPYVRGHERSRSKDAIIREVQALSESGTKEIILLGQNVNSYQGGDDRFADLLYSLNEIPGIDRIRFMTSHPKDISLALMNAMKDCDHVCKQLHLPVQSGSNEILRRMNRRYTAEIYREKVMELRQLIPDIALTTDIIVGFPGETPDDFQQTLDLVNDIRFVTGYFFKYSPRPGTPAAKFENQIDEDIKQERLATLLKLQDGITNEYNRSLIGKTLHVMPEKTADRHAGQIIGRSDGGRTVHFLGSSDLLGSTVPVTITDVTGNTLLGVIRN